MLHNISKFIRSIIIPRLKALNCTKYMQKIRVYDMAFFYYLDNRRINPSKALAVPGRTIMITCHTRTQAAWLYNEGVLPNNAKILNVRVLAIEGVKISNRGYYECQGTSKWMSFIARSTLAVLSELHHIFQFVEHTVFYSYIHSEHTSTAITVLPLPKLFFWNIFTSDNIVRSL